MANSTSLKNKNEPSVFFIDSSWLGYKRTAYCLKCHTDLCTFWASKGPNLPNYCPVCGNPIMAKYKGLV